MSKANTKPKKTILDWYDSPAGIDHITNSMRHDLSNEEADKLNKLMKSGLARTKLEEALKNKIVKVEKPKPKPKPLKPRPTIQEQLEFEDYLNTLDPIWWKDLKITSQPSIESSNAEWWENEFLDYKKDGGPLPFLKFKEMMLNEADLEFSKQIDKRVKDKIKDEGLSEEFTKQKIMEGKFL